MDHCEDLKAFEEMFKDRFTENDEAFMELKSKPLPPPPIVCPWKLKQKEWNRRRNYVEEREGGHRGYHRDYKDRRHDHRDRRNDHRDRKNEYRDRSHSRQEERHRGHHDTSYYRHRDQSGDGKDGNN